MAINRANASLLGAVIHLLGYGALVSASAVSLPPQEEVAVFEAAGYALKGNQWRSNCIDTDTLSYTPGEIVEVRDLNGDGLPEALIYEGGTGCYGNTGVGFSLVSKQADGGWKLITSGVGIPTFLTTMGDNSWPDIEIGGSGFCFVVERWNGHEYVLQRYQYEGTPCQP